LAVINFIYQVERDLRARSNARSAIMLHLKAFLLCSVLRERFAYKMQAAEKDGKDFNSYANQMDCGSIN